MRDVNDIQAERPDQGFQFPGTFEIAAMGAAGVDLESRVPGLLEALGLTVEADSVRVRQSSAGHYVAVHVRFHCTTREDYEAAHATLRADDNIRYTL